MRAARVAIHLARTLRFLHKHKVVHGNITPNNVLIRAGDKQTKLADLMLVKALNGSVLQQSFLKKKLLAEAPYLAPEQTRAGAGGDEATDLYALGAVAYALATGRAPFAGETPEQIIDQVAHTAVPRPSKYQKGIPANFEAVLLKLLAKRQEDRYATADLLLGDLEPIAMEHGTSL
jgi:serine/threonine protein kinase